jgi:hypothetical protein
MFCLSAQFSYSENSCEQYFTSIWQTNYWGGVSASGTGSDLIQTEVIRTAIPLLLQKYNCKSMIDAPCGDFYWMKTVDLPLDKYIGVDIVKPLIDENQRLFSSQKCSFLYQNMITEMLPKADLVLCRDCLVHFSYADIAKTIKLLKQSGSTYLLTTGFTRDHFMLNDQISTGEWRPLDLRLAPFYFPEPLEIINENCTVINNSWNDKSLFLWKIADLPDLEELQHH